MEKYKQCNQVLRRIAKRFPTTKWIWVISVDGLVIAGIGGVIVDLRDIVSDQDIDTLEDIPSDITVSTDYSPVSIASVIGLDLSDRILKEFKMEAHRFTIFSADEMTLILLPIGKRDDYFLSMAIHGQKELGKVIEHMPECPELSEIDEIWQD